MTALTLDPTAPTPAQVARTGRSVDTALWLVALAVGLYSLANVHAVANAHQVDDPQAWLLAPIVDVALFAGITADAMLSRCGADLPGWGALLRWFCGVATWTLNVWDAAGSGDIGAVVVHSVPPIVLILLAEAAPRYRQRFAALVHRPAPTTDMAPVPPAGPRRTGTGTTRRPASGATRPRGTGATRRPAGSGRRELTRALAELPADDPRSDRQLAADLAPAAGLTPATARKYLAEIRSSATAVATEGGA